MPDTQLYNWEQDTVMTYAYDGPPTVNSSLGSFKVYDRADTPYTRFVTAEEMEEYIKRICKIITEHVAIDISEDEVMRLIKGE